MALQQVAKGMTTGFADLLDANFAYLDGAVAAMEQVLADAILYMHGEGKQLLCDLATGTGLWVEVGSAGGDNVFWVNGKRYVIPEPPFIVPLPANSTKYVYIGWDDENAVPTYRMADSKSLPSPVSEWYAGSATTDIDSCTAVDMADAETVNADLLQETLQQILEDVELLKAAVGDDYLGETPPALSLDERVDLLEAGDISGVVIYWKLLGKAAGDPTTIEQQIDSDIAQHVTDYHSGQPDTDPNVDFIITEYDVDAANMARAWLLLCRTVQPSLFQFFSDAAWIVWLVSGDGTDEFDNVDWDNSDWVVTP